MRFHYDRRDACNDDLRKTGEDPYLTCLTLLQSIQIDGFDPSPANVDAYCTSFEDCVTNIRSLLHDLAVDCQGGDVSSL